MTIYHFLQNATTWLSWTGAGLGLATIICILFGWNAKFRLIGATIFTFLVAASCWAFNESYRPPFIVEGAEYAPVVYDNGLDLVDGIRVQGLKILKTWQLVGLLFFVD